MHTEHISSADRTHHLFYLHRLFLALFPFDSFFLLFISSLSFIIRVRINNDQWDLSVCKLCFVQMKKKTHAHTQRMKRKCKKRMLTCDISLNKRMKKKKTKKRKNRQNKSRFTRNITFGTTIALS